MLRPAASTGWAPRRAVNAASLTMCSACLAPAQQRSRFGASSFPFAGFYTLLTRRALTP